MNRIVSLKYQKDPMSDRSSSGTDSTSCEFTQPLPGFAKNLKLIIKKNLLSWGWKRSRETVNGIVRQWGLTYSGESGLPFDIFLLLLEGRRDMENLSEDELFESLPEILTGDAARRYRNLGSWDEFVIDGYMSSGMEAELQRKLHADARSRTQYKDERVLDFLSQLHSLLSKLQPAWTTEMQLDLLLRNMRPEFQVQIQRSELTGVEDLMQKAEGAEWNWMRSCSAFAEPPSPDFFLLSEVRFKAPSKAVTVKETEITMEVPRQNNDSSDETVTSSTLSCHCQSHELEREYSSKWRSMRSTTEGFACECSAFPGASQKKSPTASQMALTPLALRNPSPTSSSTKLDKPVPELKFRASMLTVKIGNTEVRGVFATDNTDIIISYDLARKLSDDFGFNMLPNSSFALQLNNGNLFEISHLVLLPITFDDTTYNIQVVVVEKVEPECYLGVPFFDLFIAKINTLQNEVVTYNNQVIPLEEEYIDYPPLSGAHSVIISATP